MEEQLLRLRSQGVEWVAVEGEVVALDLQSSSYFSANQVGAMLWERLAAGATRDDLVAMMVERFGIDRPTAEEDLEGFLAQLTEAGLLER